MEKGFWLNYRLLSRNEETRKVIDTMVNRVEIKLRDARRLVEYTEQPVLERVRKAYKKLEDLSDEELIAKRARQLLLPNGDLEGDEFQRYFSAEE